MKKILIILVALLVGAYIVAFTLSIDPDERRPGLRLGGEVAQQQNTNWSFLEGRNKIYVQMQTWYLLPHSITTTSWVTDNELYVPCGRCATKIWPNYVAKNADVRLKVNGFLYDRTAVRITDEAEKRHAMQLPAADPLPEGVWIYRMEPRS